MPQVVLLGPQRFKPTVASVLDDLEIEGPVAAVTAGWQEREEDDRELRVHCNRTVVNLQLYRRAEEILAHDSELAGALRTRQDELQRLQRLYRQRLAHALEAAREVMQQTWGGRFLLEHRRAAIRAVRTLDRQHLQRLKKIHAEFEEQWQPSERPSVIPHREEIGDALDGAAALAIAGGHVAVLLTRMRLLNLVPQLTDQPIIAWSAGAMALAQRVVLFHDSPPQGAGDPEVLDAGLGLFPGLIALPHAGKRLKLDNPVRVALFARRFSPALCAAFDENSRLVWNGEAWSAADGARRLGPRGNLLKMVRA